MIARWIYSLLFYLFTPLVLLRLLYRGLKAPAYLRRWRERLGWVSRPPSGPVVWVHAVSVGETVAAVPLIKRLQAAWPQAVVVVTTMTPTGSERVQALLGASVHHVYAPYDLPLAMSLFMVRIRPKALLIMETELWPNMIHACYRRQLPVMLINGRLSERSARRYQKVQWWVREMMTSLTWVAAQTQADAERFAQVGVPPNRISATGSIKCDLRVPDDTVAQAQQAKAALQGRPVWFAISTHEGEEAIILQAHQQLLQTHAECLLILTPRHPERFKSAVALAEATGLSVTRFSQQPMPATGTQVHVVDGMGQVLLFCGLADIAFVGGSLVERGGHNPLEPAWFGLPVLMGPHTFNFQGICDDMEQSGGLVRVKDSEQITQAVQHWLAEANERSRAGEAARAYLASKTGALDQVEQKVLSLLRGARA